MFETLLQLLEAKGPKSKAVVWAHNNHIGNAAFTEMGQVRETERWSHYSQCICRGSSTAGSGSTRPGP